MIKISKFVMNIFWILFSFTRFLVDCKKAKKNCPTPVFYASYKGDVLRIFSICYFLIDLLLFVFLTLFYNNYFFVEIPNRVITLHAITFEKILALLFLIYSLSRVNEIIYAFGRDALESISSDINKSTNLKASERLIFLLRSYFGLIVNFAILYYFFPLNAFEIECLFEGMINFHDAVFYSAASIAAFNFDQIKSVHLASRFLTMLEVFSGIFLLTFAVAVYFSELSKRPK